MSVLFGKLHQALVAQGGDRIGVSFPDLDESRSRLGERLRIHASADDLRALLARPWLEGLRDHLQFGEAAVVPHPHRTVRSVGFRRKAIRNVCGGGSCAGTI